MIPRILMKFIKNNYDFHRLLVQFIIHLKIPYFECLESIRILYIVLFFLSTSIDGN